MDVDPHVENVIPDGLEKSSAHMNHEMRVGMFLDAVGDEVGPRREIWHVADEAGFDHLWHDDHLLTLVGGADPDGSVLESWTLLAAMAEPTKQVRVGVLVTGIMPRSPGILAKIAVTIDRISGGRLEMAMGPGWADVELISLGMQFAGARERIERLDEACTVLKMLWTQARSDFEGKHYRLVDAISEPKPVQKPHPPLWIGAEGKRTLRVAARHADVWNTPAMGLDVDLEAARILDEHCLDIGRDPAEIRRSVLIPATSVDEVCSLAEQYAAAGFSDLILEVPHTDDPMRGIETVAIPAMARIRELEAAPVG
jgi:alkanesulfonate monooxygenase SsuD/methylene tetrahydromethanopterin reductase-like flavin-dependent oxidoreductase (luciferase family)